MVKKKLYFGVGATCTILTRFIHPKQSVEDKSHRSTVVVTGQEVKKVNRKQQTCLLFQLDGIDCYAVKNHFIVTEEGDMDDFFDIDDVEKAKSERAEFVESTTKWKKSDAKKILWNDLLEGRIPSAVDSTEMSLDDIDNMHKEYSKLAF